MPGVPSAAGRHVHDQWASDVAVWESSGHDLASVKANRPRLKVKPIFGCEAYFITDDCIEKGSKQRRYHLILLAKNETGYVNLIVWEHVAERERRALVGSRLMGVAGELQLEGEVMHVIARRIVDLTSWLGRLEARSRDFH